MTQKPVLLLLAPIVLALDIYLITWVFEWLTMPSNLAVVAGVAGLGVLLFLNYYLFRYTTTRIKS